MARSSTLVSASTSSCASSCSGLWALIFSWPGRNLEPDAAVLLVGQDRGTLQRGAQHLAIDPDLTVGADRDHRVVVREAAIDQLAGKGHVVALDPDVAAADLQLELAVAAFQQTLQFLHALARHDDLALGLAPPSSAASHSARR